MDRMRMMGLALAATVLTACGSTTTTTAPTTAPAATVAAAPTAPAATAAQEATTAALATTAPEATTGSVAPTAAADTATGARVFTIVPAQTTASYEVQETFLQQNLPYTAIGTTSDVSGQVSIDLSGQPTGEVTEIVVDLRTLKSDSDRRDNAIRERWLESNTYPEARFVSTGIEGAPATYTDGETVSFKLVGDMTIRNVTKPLTFDVQATLQGNTLTGTATTAFLMTDFGFEPPTIAGAISVEEGVKLKIDFTASE